MSEYKEHRAHLINQLAGINFRFFPRCFRARLRDLAKLDAEHDGTTWEENYTELLNQFKAEKDGRI